MWWCLCGVCVWCGVVSCCVVSVWCLCVVWCRVVLRGVCVVSCRVVLATLSLDGERVAFFYGAPDARGAGRRLALPGLGGGCHGERSPLFFSVRDAAVCRPVPAHKPQRNGPDRQRWPARAVWGCGAGPCGQSCGGAAVWARGVMGGCGGSRALRPVD